MAPSGGSRYRPDDVPDLGLQGRVGAELEGLGAVGLEPSSRQIRWTVEGLMPVRGAIAGRSSGSCPRAAGPWRGRPPGRGPRGCRWADARPRGIGQAVEARLGVPPAPQLDGHDRHAQLGGDALDRATLGRAEHDPGTGHRPLLARGRTHHGHRAGADRPCTLTETGRSRRDHEPCPESFPSAATIR